MGNIVKTDFCRSELGDGYYIEYRYVDLAMTNMTLYRGDGEYVNELTDRYGNINGFPGIVEGKWREKLHIEIIICVQYGCFIEPFDENGLAGFIWTLQPDGRFWADDEGYGIEPDEKINMISKFDKNGNFVMPFENMNIKL